MTCCGETAGERPGFYMSIPKEIREQAMVQMQGAMALHVAYIGIYNGLFSAIAEMKTANPDELTARTGLDIGYLQRWCDAAYGFGLLDEVDGKLTLADTGKAFISDAVGTAMPFAVQSMISAHMAERAAVLMRSGERPGEKVLAERQSIIALFGPMLEAMFSGIFEEQIVQKLPVDRKSTRLNSSHMSISYAVFCLKRHSTIWSVPMSQMSSTVYAILSRTRLSG